MTNDQVPLNNQWPKVELRSRQERRTVWDARHCHVREGIDRVPKGDEQLLVEMGPLFALIGVHRRIQYGNCIERKDRKRCQKKYIRPLQPWRCVI